MVGVRGLGLAVEADRGTAVEVATPRGEAVSGILGERAVTAEETAAVRPVAASAAHQGALVAMTSVAVTVRHSRPVRIPVHVSLHRAAGRLLRTVAHSPVAACATARGWLRSTT
ncbi:hypothetical protein GCM10009646_24370 [Streptomyces aureus]